MECLTRSNFKPMSQVNPLRAAQITRSVFAGAIPRSPYFADTDLKAFRALQLVREIASEATEQECVNAIRTVIPELFSDYWEEQCLVTEPLL